MKVQRFEYTTRGAVHCDGPCGCVINGATVEVRISFNDLHPASAYYCAACAPSPEYTNPEISAPPAACRFAQEGDSRCACMICSLQRDAAQDRHEREHGHFA